MSIDGEGDREQGMPSAMVEDWDQFNAFLAAQPLCVWAAEKKQEVAKRAQGSHGRSTPAPPANDNADLLAALSSMA